MQGGRDPQTVIYTLYMPTTSIQPKQMTEIPFLKCIFPTIPMNAIQNKT